MNLEILPKPGVIESLASAWLGELADEHSEHKYPSARLDLMTNAWLGRLTGNISPATLANAYFDWVTHLQLSPSKQEKLMQKFWQKLWR